MAEVVLMFMPKLFMMEVSRKQMQEALGYRTGSMIGGALGIEDCLEVPIKGLA